MAEKQEFTRKLKSRHIQLMALGGTIGTGLFLGSGKVIHVILLAYLITGIICFGIMRALEELLLSDLHYHSFMDAIRDYLGNRVSGHIGRVGYHWRWPKLPPLAYIFNYGFLKFPNGYRD